MQESGSHGVSRSLATRTDARSGRLIGKVKSINTPTQSHNTLTGSNAQSQSRFLRTWAALSLLSVGLMFAFPSIIPAWPLQSVPEILISGSLGLLSAGFHFYCLFDCIFRRRVRYKLFWVAFLLVLPLFSAYIYVILAIKEGQSDSMD